MMSLTRSRTAAGSCSYSRFANEARELGGRSGDLSGDWSSGGHGRISDQSSFAPESFTALAHFTISDLTSVVNSSVVEIAGSAARLISLSRISGCR